MIRIAKFCSTTAALLAALALGVTTTGCGPEGNPDPGSEEVGTLGFHLQLAEGVEISEVSYTIEGNGYLKSGILDVFGSHSITAQIGGIPPGDGYTITLSATDDTGEVTCAGSATFDVEAGATTAVSVHLRCRVAPRTGGVLVDGTLNLCPFLDVLDALPAETSVGHSISLSATATDLDGAPAGTTYAWSATSGSFSDASAAAPSFTCTDAGQVTVSVDVSDGDCTDTASVEVTCSGAEAPPVVVHVNEVESSGGDPGDWIELVNAGDGEADLSSWVVKDNADDHAYMIPVGTILAAGAYLVIDESDLGFGLGGGDSARLYDAEGSLIEVFTWASHAVVTYGRCPDATGEFEDTLTATKGSANDCIVPVPEPVVVKVNEVESSGGDPGDWAELVNAGTGEADLSGWTFKDNADDHAYVIPDDTVLAAGAYLVIDESDLGFGLGNGDSARLFDAEGTLVDTYTWAAHAAVTYGRCPDATGDFEDTVTATKGAANDCEVVEPDDGFDPWPGGEDVSSVDPATTFGSNASGLTYQPAVGEDPAVLWAVQNSPSKLFKLLWNGAEWAPSEDDDWGAGKTLHYADGTGAPDSEGVTKADWDSSIIYVAAERNNQNNGVSRMSILRYDTADAGDTLTALNEWEVTDAIPAAGANLGLEAVTYIPDDYLTAHGFLDENTGAAYDPDDYADHGSGLFFVGVEGTGKIHVFALDHTGDEFTRIATILSGHVGVMGLEFDRDNGYLWAQCDNTCGNRVNLLEIDEVEGSATLGTYQVLGGFEKPTGLGDFNNEGIAIAPESECVEGVKSFYWSDDGDTDGHSIRAGTVNCGPLF